MTAFDITFRRTDTDRRKPREVVTGRLLGDPPADLAERRQEAVQRPHQTIRVAGHKLQCRKGW